MQTGAAVVIRRLFIIALAVLVAAGFHVFGWQAFRVPSGSMKPALLVGDSVLVNKFAYGTPFRRCIAGWCPDTPPWGAPPERGDVIVFRDTIDGGFASKRVVGLPGEEIAILNGRIHIDGQRIDRRTAGMFNEIYEAQGRLGQTPLCANPDASPGGYCAKPVLRETLPGGVAYDTLQIGMAAADFMAPRVVPPGHYFVLGDNRDNSTDSRIRRSDGGYGTIPLEHIVGRADLILFSSEADNILKFRTMRPGRFFLPIDEATARAAQ